MLCFTFVIYTLNEEVFGSTDLNIMIKKLHKKKRSEKQTDVP